jgi:hypothetical protein
VSCGLKTHQIYVSNGWRVSPMMRIDLVVRAIRDSEISLPHFRLFRSPFMQYTCAVPVTLQASSYDAFTALDMLRSKHV